MNTKEILKAFPQPDGKILRTIDKEACEKAVRQIIAGGSKTVREIVDLIFEPGKGEDIQPRHALHATAIRVGGYGKEKERKAFASSLAATLMDERPKAVKGFVIRQLQVCGGIEQGSAIAKFLTDPDEHIYEYAAQALEAIGPETVSHFRKAYAKAKGAPRLTILQGLGVLEDSESKAAFRNATKDKNLEIRLAGLWGLMRIASAEDVDLLLAQSQFPSSVNPLAIPPISAFYQQAFCEFLGIRFPIYVVGIRNDFPLDGIRLKHLHNARAVGMQLHSDDRSQFSQASLCWHNDSNLFALSSRNPSGDLMR